MLTLRTAPWVACALLAVLLGMPASASAITAPSLQSPAPGAASFKEGGSMTFEWSGQLQGHADAISRSYFRIEISKAADVPSGAQAEWTKLENFIQTEPGQQVTSVDAGVPAAGSYRWRVCAWGVVDPVVANEIVQLPGGCSATRAFETSAVASSGGAIGELKMEERSTVGGEVNTVWVTRPDPKAATQEAPVVEQPAPPAPEPQEEPPARFTPVKTLDLGKQGSALGLGGDGTEGDGGPEALFADDAANREGIGGAVLDGLGATLPLVPVPFWTLALLLACLPIARLWRGSVLGMFEWADGTIDGSGGPDDVLGDLVPVRSASALKNSSMTADGDATVRTTTADPAPDRGRRAA